MGKNKNKIKSDKKIKKNKSSKSKSKSSKSSSKSKKEEQPIKLEEVEVVEVAEVVEQTVEETVSTEQVADTSSDIVSSEPNKEEEEPTFVALSAEFQAQYTQFIKLGKQLNNDFKTLVKVHNREIRSTKKFRKKRNTDKSKDPSGFNKPTLVPTKVAELFNIDKDTMLARTVVTKMIYDYIKEHKLQVEEDKRKINPDEALTDLFELKEDDELSFKSFQTHMKKLYPSKASKPTTQVSNA